MIQDHPKLSSKIKKHENDSFIHKLFVFNKSGVCFYGRNFTDYIKVEKNLISPFISALMSFGREMIGKRFQLIEMEDVKIVIFEKDSLYYGVLCDTFENLTLLDDLISKIHTRLILYLKKNDVNVNAEIIYDSALNETVERVINDALNRKFGSKKERKVIHLLKDFSLTEEIAGIILLTNRGKIIYSSFNKIDVKKFLREVEFRVKIYNNSILKLFYTLSDKKFIFSEYILNTYFLILVFNPDVKFGLADHYLTKMVDKIKNTLVD